MQIEQVVATRAIWATAELRATQERVASMHPQMQIHPGYPFTMYMSAPSGYHQWGMWSTNINILAVSHLGPPIMEIDGLD